MRESEINRLNDIIERMSDEELAAKLLKLTRVADNPRHRDYVSYHLIKDEYDKRKWIRGLGGEYVPKSDRQKKLEKQIKKMHWLLYWHDNATRNAAVLPREELVEINGLEHLRLVTSESSRKMPQDGRDQFVRDGVTANRSRILDDIERLRRELRFVISREHREREARMQVPKTRRSKTPAYKRRSRKRFRPEEIAYYVPLWTKGVQEILDSHLRMKVEEAIKKYASTTKKVFGEPFSWATIRNRIYDPGFAFRRKRRTQLSETINRENLPP
jgi:hypothetical protein